MDPREYESCERAVESYHKSLEARRKEYNKPRPVLMPSDTLIKSLKTCLVVREYEGKRYGKKGR